MRALVGLLVLVPCIALAQVPVITVEELQQNPALYNHKTVRLRGQLDSCAMFGTSCMICPEDMTVDTYDSDACMTVAFHDASASPSDVEWRADNLLRELYRWATVTLDITLEGGCWPPEEVICTDGSEIYGARVVEVHSRKNALDGLEYYDEGTLTLAEGGERSAMLTALFPKGTFYEMATKPEDRQVFVHVPPDPEAETRAGLVIIGEPSDVVGVGCICVTEGDCQDRWPTRKLSAFNSPANPFYCWDMQKRDDGWYVVPGL